ncbi:hypothetical protein [Hahella ganghwensis]|uniref:hypothetical protein n=1 Tax=Hahella ganghwensis TaxID=286420 RepID=UPI00038238FA|nr:hypothetical protein [Hahella ganghwensis]
MELTMKSVNLCGVESPYQNYQLAIYDDQGRIENQYTPDTDGHIETEINRKTADIGIFTRSTNKTSEDTEVLILSNFPISDLGTLYVSSFDSTDCLCETADVIVSPSSGSSEKISAPYRSLINSSPENTNTYQKTQLCAKQGEKTIPLMVAHADSNSGKVLYKLMPNPYSRVFAGELVVDMQGEGSPGRELPITGKGGDSARALYSVDSVHSLSVESAGMPYISVLDDEDGHVKKLSVTVSHQEAPSSDAFPFQHWHQIIPLDNSTDAIQYSKPALDPATLANNMELSDTEYDTHQLNGSFLQVLQLYTVTDKRTDAWHYFLPLDGHKPKHYEVPLGFSTASGHYPKSPGLQEFDVRSINDVEHLKELYTSEWLSVFIRKSPTPIRPPAAYSTVNIATM